MRRCILTVTSMKKPRMLGGAFEKLEVEFEYYYFSGLTTVKPSICQPCIPLR